MRVWIDEAANQSSANIAGLLRKRGFEISKYWPQVKLDVVAADTDPALVVVDGVVGELESNVTHWIATMLEQGGVPRHVALRRHGGIQDERALKINLPADDQVRAIAEQAIVAAVEVTLKGKTSTGAKRSVWGRLFPELRRK